MKMLLLSSSRRLSAGVLKISILIFFIALSGKSTAQDLNVYSFEVEDVDNIASAKEMTDYIRPLFNTPEKPYDYFPWFNATDKKFEFKSNVLVNEDELRAVLENQTLVLLSFNRTIVTVPVPTSNTSKE